LQLIDTHVHIKFPQYDNDRAEMMQRAYDSGVTRMLHSCCTTAEMQTIIDFADYYDGDSKVDLYYGLGVHPTEIQTWTPESAQLIRDAACGQRSRPKHKLRAIGETGLDYYHVREATEQERQRAIFNEQIDIAQELSLPLIVHTRDAWEDTLAVIKDRYPVGSERSGTLHCYTGEADFAQACIDRGFYVSWSGIVSFKNSPQLREAAMALPLERTLIETDCPYLAPQAKRGQRNEPSYVHYVAETLATVYNKTKEEICIITTENAERLFRFI
jgi:TatD DNase family protein